VIHHARPRTRKVHAHADADEQIRSPRFIDGVGKNDPIDKSGATKN